MRYVGLDVHKRVLQAHLISDDGTRQDLRLALTADTLQRFARQHLGADCQVALEATTNTWAVVDLLTPHCAQVVVSNPMATRAIAYSKIKTDKVDARVLAELLRCDYLPTVYTPDAPTRAQRSIAARRSALTRQSVSLKNRIQSVLHQRLIQAPKSLFCSKGRAWLQTVSLPDIDRLEIATLTRLLDVLQEEQAQLALRMDQYAYTHLDIQRLITLPGVDVATAQAMLASIGDIRRFPCAKQLAAYFGLVPSIHQSADKTFFGKITKQGNKNVRWLLIQAAQIAARHPGPLGHQFARLQKRKGRNVAVVAIAHKLAQLAWHLITHQQTYRYALPATVQTKLQRIRVNATGNKKTTGPKKGSPKTPSGTPQTRLKKSLSQILLDEGLPQSSQPPAAESRIIQRMGLDPFAARIEQPERLARKKRPLHEKSK
jgi:transposase